MTKSLLILVILITALPAVAQNEAAPKQSTPAWTPHEVPAELMESVINGNLFVPNQRRVPRVEPPPGEETDNQPADQTREPEVIDQDDPDRDYRLIGSSYTGGQWLAFIENSQTREIHRVAVDQSIASGKVSSIDYDRIEYAVNDETRAIQIGRDLTGAEPRASLESELSNLFAPVTTTDQTPSPTGTTESTNAPATESATGDNSRAEILRRLRERRERESQ